MTPHEAFQQFCQQHGIEPTERDYVFWLGALQSTRTQQPVAYAPLVSGVPVGVLDAVLPGMRAVVPLYASPVAPVDKPELTREAIKSLWEVYYLNDPEGLARAVERYYRK